MQPLLDCFLADLPIFINGELYGRVTNLPGAVKFPLGGGLPRHPSQLYEAFGEDLLPLGLLYYLQRKESSWRKPGYLSGVFLIGYSLVRFLVEFVREPNVGLDDILGFTMGQILCVPMALLGVYLCQRRSQNK